MTAKRTLGLLHSKLSVCKRGYEKALEQGDRDAALQWKRAFIRTKDRIHELGESQ